MRGFWTRLGAALAALALPGAVAYAQGTVQQSGAVTPFHLSPWYSNGVQGDGGTPAAPYVNSLGMFNGANCPFGISSQTTPGASGAAHATFSICQTSTTSTLHFLGVGQSAPAVYFDIGGTSYPFPGPGGGTVVGPSSAVDSDLACFNTTSGTLLKDCGAKLPLPIASGGTGQITAPLAINALLPSQAGNSGKVLSTNGSAAAWSASGNGTVSSVGISGGTTGLTASGSPVTTSGTITLGGTLAITNGGTGQITAPLAINALAPPQAGNSGKFLTTNGSVVSWGTPGGGGGGLGTVFDIVATYGGDPTGVGDNTTAYNNAKAACVAGGRGGILWFQGGTYKFLSKITDAADGCSIAGVGRDATILKPASISGDFLSVTSSGIAAITVSNLQIANGGSWTSGYALNIQDSWNGVHDVWISGTPNGIHHTNAADGFFYNILFNDLTSSPIVACDNASGDVFGSHWDNVSIAYFSGNTTATGIHQGAGCNSLILSRIDNVYGNICLDNTTDSGSFTTLYDFECDHSQGGVVFNGGDGIQISNSWIGSTLVTNGVTFASTFSKYATITGSQIRDNNLTGVLLNGSGGVAITGNVISGNASNNVAVGANVSNFTVSGNQIGVPGDPTATYCVIVVAGTSNRYNISNNVCGANNTNGVTDAGTGTKKFVSGNTTP